MIERSALFAFTKMYVILLMGAYTFVDAGHTSRSLTVPNLLLHLLRT